MVDRETLFQLAGRHAPPGLRRHVEIRSADYREAVCGPWG